MLKNSRFTDLRYWATGSLVAFVALSIAPLTLATAAQQEQPSFAGRWEYDSDTPGAVLDIVPLEDGAQVFVYTPAMNVTEEASISDRQIRFPWDLCRLVQYTKQFDCWFEGTLSQDGQFIDARIEGANTPPYRLRRVPQSDRSSTNHD